MIILYGAIGVAGFLLLTLIGMYMMSTKIRSEAWGFFLGLFGIIGLIIIVKLKDYKEYLSAVGIHENEKATETEPRGYIKKGKLISKDDVRDEIKAYLKQKKLSSIEESTLDKPKAKKKTKKVSKETKKK